MPENTHIEGVCYDPELPVLEREQLEMLLMVDEDEEEGLALVREIFGLFQTESADRLFELDMVCQRNDLDALRKIVHFVAGSAGNLGLARMCGFYRGIEQAIDTGTLTDLGSCAEPIRVEFKNGCEVFKKEFGL